MKGLSRIVLLVVVVAGCIACKSHQASTKAKASPDSETTSAAAAVVGAKESVSMEGLVWLKSTPPKIELTRGEVTVAQYAACVKAGKCTAPQSKNEEKSCNWGYADRDQHPINCVNWYQATDFCEWAGGRLPTEQEWYAEASNGGSRKYPWGDAEVTCDYAIWGDGSKTDGCGKDSTWPVCSKERGNSVSGLCDMSGNVWEWTSTADDTARVLRGGSWGYDNPDHLQASYRPGLDPTDGSDYSDGFRCGRPAKP